jgi:hypothetical protein
MTDAERAKMRDLRAMVAGIGAHAGHTRRQIGRCVHCSCGARAQARLPAWTAPGEPVVPCWEVVLPDGFVCYQGTDPGRASQVAARHDGAVVRQAHR